MAETSRRGIIAGVTGLAAIGAAHAQSAPQPERDGKGATVMGPRNLAVTEQEPDLLAPPATDHGTIPNLKFSFAQAHTRIEPGGWAREVTVRELPVSTAMAGVNMRLTAGGIRELHWHKQAEWAYMIAGTARVTAIDPSGRSFVGDLGVGDLWYFPGGTPHSIQGLGSDGCEFLLVFPDGAFSENSTFLISDWFAHTPRSVLAKNFGVSEAGFADIPSKELYILQSSVPGSLQQEAQQAASPAGAPPNSFIHRMLAQDPAPSASGSVRITDMSNFPVSNDIAAALVEVPPGGMREMHWHPLSDEWQYYLDGQGRMTVFASNANARTFDYLAGDVGYVPKSMGHYIENTGTVPLRFLEMFTASQYQDVSLSQWMGLTPPALIEAHLHLKPEVMAALPRDKRVVVG